VSSGMSEDGQVSGPPLSPIDPKDIPERILVDTNVLVLALEYEAHKGDPKAIDCRDFWEAALRKQHGRVLVAAPSIAEFNAKSAVGLPVNRKVEVVAFCRIAAEALALHFPAGVTRSLRKNFAKHLIKYDSMIVACAYRAKADVLVSTDEDLIKTACEAMNVQFRTPGSYRPSRDLVIQRPDTQGRFEFMSPRTELPGIVTAELSSGEATGLLPAPDHNEAPDTSNQSGEPG